MTNLQSPIKEGFDAVNDDLRAVTRAQRDFGKSLDKVSLLPSLFRPPAPVPTSSRPADMRPSRFQ